MLKVSAARIGQMLVVLSLGLLTGCQTPEERAQGYYEKGMALIEKKDDLNARVQITTALKFKSDKIEAWRALLRGRRTFAGSDAAELVDHLREQIASLNAVGLSDDEAFLVAVKRMGGIDALTREFAREHS